MIVLGIDPGFRNCGYCIVERKKGQKTPLLHRWGTLENGALAHWQAGIPSLLKQLTEATGGYSLDRVAVECISWYGKRRGSLQLAHLAGALYGYFYEEHVTEVQFFLPRDVKAMSQKLTAPADFTEHELDALSLCHLALHLG